MGEPIQFFQFVWIMSGKWLVWVGCILTAFGVVKHIMEKTWKRDFPQIPEVIQKYLWWIVGVCLIIATYQAWLDEHLKLESANLTLVKVQAENQEKDRRIHDLKAQQGNNSQKRTGSGIGFYDEDIVVPIDKAIGLNPATIRLMEASPDHYYSATISVQDNNVAWLATGGVPTIKTKQILNVGDMLTLSPIENLKQFKAIAIGGAATLAVSYYREK